MCVLYVWFLALCFSAMDYFSLLFFGGFITTTCFCPLYSFRRIIVICVVFMMSIDVCYCREDIRYFYGILVFQGFLLKFVSLVYQKVWFRLLWIAIFAISLLFTLIWWAKLWKQELEKYSSISFGKCLEWRTCYEYSSTSFLGRGRVGFTLLSYDLPVGIRIGSWFLVLTCESYPRSQEVKPVRSIKTFPWGQGFVMIVREICPSGQICPLITRRG